MAGWQAGRLTSRELCVTWVSRKALLGPSLAVHVWLRGCTRGWVGLG